jgi:hypothetical protein
MIALTTIESVSVGDVVCKGLSGFKKIPLSTELSPLGDFAFQILKTIFLTSTLLVHVYTKMGSNNTYAIAGTIATDGTITYGSETSISTLGLASYHQTLSADRLTDSTFIVFSQGYCIACSVSGTTITYGSPVVPEASIIASHQNVHRITDTTFAAIYIDSTNYLTCRVGSLSTLVVSFPSAAVDYAAAAVAGVYTERYDSSSILVIFDYNNVNVIAARVSVSGTTPTWNTTHAFAFNALGFADCPKKLLKITDDEFVAFFAKSTPTRLVAFPFRYAQTTVSSVILKEEIIIEQDSYTGSLAGTIEGIEAVYLGDGLIAIAIRDYRARAYPAGIKLLKYSNRTVGPSFPLITIIDDQINSSQVPNPGQYGSSVIIDSGFGRIFFVYRDLMDVGGGQSGGYTRGRWIDIPIVIGVALSSGTSPIVITRGKIGGFTSLVIGVRYYIDPLGRLTDQPWSEVAYLGTAISTTEILIKH